MNKQGRTLTYDGVTDTIQGWARRLNISDVTIRRRLASGYSDEKALTEPILPVRGGRTKVYEYNGETKTLKAWAKQYNMSESTLFRRLKQKGWDMKTALETPTDGSSYGCGYADMYRDGEVTIDDVIDILNK
jgi:hypothetical protein